MSVIRTGFSDIRCSEQTRRDAVTQSYGASVERPRYARRP
jgi:hypothetical protein